MARPTDDPKGTMLAVRLATRHVQLLEWRAARDHISVSEALRRYLDEAGHGTQAPRSRPPTAEELRTFEQAVAALGFKIRARSTAKQRVRVR
jgi:hypothetical protein